MKDRHIVVDNEFSPILVFALAGKVGSGVSFVRDKLNQELTTYGYEIEIFDVSRIILQEQYEQYSSETDLKDLTVLNKADLVEEMQRRGNYLRERGGGSFVGKMIFLDFIVKDFVEKNELKGRKAYIVDSLKHPDEASFLRKVFGDAFYLVGVIANDSVRKNRLIERKNFSENEYERISIADEKQTLDFGQQTVGTLIVSDYFLENNYPTKDAIAQETERFLRLIFNTSLDTPTKDEVGMNLAFQASFGSACLSRQVGAAIFSSDGQILATGKNDVPQFGGGLYATDSPMGDKRCWTHGAKCYNDNEKKRIIEEIISSVESGVASEIKDDLENLLATVSDSEEKEKLKLNIMKSVATEVEISLNSSRIKRLLEFSRSIHAEMDALLSVARKGIKGLVDSTLYCTTYPCHNCAKHLVGAGIKRVVYLEPYEKSLARKLHTDSICDPSQDAHNSKLKIDFYSCVSPRRYNQFFSAACVERKSNGQFNDNDRKRTSLLPKGAQSKAEFRARLDVISNEAKSCLLVEEK